MRSLRKANEIRRPSAVIDFCPAAAASLLYEAGNTRIICAVSISENPPEHAFRQNTGWLTADYNLLPYSTNPRNSRDFLKVNSRALEIKRLIGRSLRGALDLSLIKGLLFEVDCDVIQADGGTRTASITGSFIALRIAVNRLLSSGVLHADPLLFNVAAVSAGYVDGQLLLDLEYSEDSAADVDLNIVMNDSDEIIEIQGTAERAPFPENRLNSMIQAGRSGIRDLIAFQNSFQE